MLPGRAEVHAEETAFVERKGPGARQGRLAVTAVDEMDSTSPVVGDVVSSESSSRHVLSGLMLERRTWSSAPGSQLVACVDIQPAPGSGADTVRPDVLWGLAIRRMERCVRPGDRICMLGGSRVGLWLGNGADRVAPSSLGKRVARALGDHLAIGATGLDLLVTIGIGTGSTDVEPDELMSAAMAGMRSTHSRAQNGDGGFEPFLAVTHVPNDATEPGGGLCRRVVVPMDDDTEVPAEELVRAPRLQGIVDQSVAITAALGGTPLRLLIVDPDANLHDEALPGVDAVGNIARRLGAWPIVCPPGDPESALLNVYVTQPDAVVIILQPQPPRRARSSETTQPWERPAHLARVLREAGVPVIAVSLGASAAALAVCVEQGAAGLFHPEQLAQELAHLASSGTKATNGNSTNGHDETQRSPGQLPGPYDALVHLTPSERRVLFYLMEGRSASEIATTLVVSLTTVRSHIRSILRKLNVNSQLAAVALAFGTLSVDPSVS